MLELLKLLLEYSKRGRLADKEFIINIVRMETNLKNLGEYVKDIKFETVPQNDDSYATAFYDSSRRMITVSLSGIEKMLETYALYLNLFSYEERLFFPNYLVCRTLVHEIEHGHNLKKRLFETSIEADLLNLTHEATLGQYYTFYNLDFDERYTRICANMEMLSLLSYIATFAPNLIDFFKVELLESIILSYERVNDTIISPTLEYFHLIGVEKYLPIFVWYNKEDFDTMSLQYRENFSLSNRLLYGFPINKEEYEMYMDILKRSRKWKIKDNISS